MQSISSEQFSAWSIGLQQSDRAAYHAVFQGMYDPLYRYAWSITKDSDAAYDVLQDVFLKLWQVRATIDPDRSLKALLYQMVRNYALNSERRRKRHYAESLDDQLIEPESEDFKPDTVDSDALEGQIHRWIEELPQRRREAFMLSRFEGLSHDEIARIMGLTKKTVNNHIVLALQHLRTRLYAFEPEYEPS